MTALITVLLVDDHAVVREGYRRLLERESRIRVAGEAHNSVSAYEQALALNPDVVVMDIAASWRKRHRGHPQESWPIARNNAC